MKNKKAPLSSQLDEKVSKTNLKAKNYFRLPVSRLRAIHKENITASRFYRRIFQKFKNEILYFHPNRVHLRNEQYHDFSQGAGRVGRINILPYLPDSCQEFISQ